MQINNLHMIVHVNHFVCAVIARELLSEIESNQVHVVQDLDDENAGTPMSSKTNHGWAWAYHKIRGLQCTRVTSAYRATLYVLRGDTGTFHSDASWQKNRIRR